MERAAGNDAAAEEEEAEVAALGLGAWLDRAPASSGNRRLGKNAARRGGGTVGGGGAPSLVLCFLSFPLRPCRPPSLSLAVEC